MKITINDIAKKANVSTATVSRALNNHPDISTATKVRIKQLATEMGYQLHSVAKFCEKSEMKRLGVLIPDITNPYFSQIIHGIEDHVSYNGYDVFLCNTNWNEKKEMKCIKAMVASGIENLIITPVSIDTVKKVKKLNNNLNVVYIAISSEDKNINYVTIDDKKAAYTATEYLIQLGHKNIIFVGGSDKTIGILNRLVGFKEALKNYNLLTPANKIINCTIERSSGYSVMLDLIHKNEIPTAIVAGNDFIALGVIDALEKNGYKVPDDVSVIGFDNIEIGSLEKINLTTIDQPKYEMGKIASEILLNELKAEKLKICNQVVVESSLTIRKTCRSIKT